MTVWNLNIILKSDFFKNKNVFIVGIFRYKLVPCEIWTKIFDVFATLEIILQTKLKEYRKIQNIRCNSHKIMGENYKNKNILRG